MITKITKANYSTVRKSSALFVFGVIWIGTMACESSSFVFKQNPTKMAFVEENPVLNLPEPMQNGDYRRSSHTRWEAVNANSNGVNCRSVNLSYDQLNDPRNSVKLDIENWPVVGTLKPGQDFEINPGPAGFGVVYDSKQNPWIYIEKTAANGAPSRCFVRANRRFVKPIVAQVRG